MAMHRELRAFLELIGDPDNSHLTEEAERAVNESIRASMTTFGWSRLPSASIKAAYEALEAIYYNIQARTVAAAALDAHSAQFYHSIGLPEPHQRIDTLLKVGKKLRLLESLYSPKRSIAHLDVVKRCTGRDYLKDFYRHLESQLEPLDRESSEFALVKRYLKNSSCCHHRERLQLVSVFRVDKPSFKHRYSPFRHFDNRQILWHGSRLQNWPGILKKGLLIAPPGVQPNGSTFGKGLYFTDKVEKAHYYCHTPPGMRSVLLLSEVALGESVAVMPLNDGKQYVRRDAGGRHDSSQYHSCRGVGSCSPDARGNVVDADGAIWPVGVPVSDKSKCSLHHTEYIIFNPMQTRMRYVVVVQPLH